MSKRGELERVCAEEGNQRRAGFITGSFALGHGVLALSCLWRKTKADNMVVD